MLKKVAWVVLILAVVIGLVSLLMGEFVGARLARSLWGERDEPVVISPPDTTDQPTFSGELHDDFEISSWASAPLLASPVAISMDDRGRAYVTRTSRRKSSNLDIRDHRDWMAQDLSLESIEDKRAFYHRMLDPSRSEENDWLEDRNDDGIRDWRDLTVEQEQVYRVVDEDDDGQADYATIFADGFETSEVTGVAAGVMPWNESVYVTVAPHLWRIRDTNDNGKADQKEALVGGFGVHMSYAGHDMSGLTMGPDGRVYWSIGDIGLSVTGPDGREWPYPHEGAVLRAEPDGSNFEVFARGLRNPQEIDFDRYGNLISVDNDGDKSGEHERIVYITEDSDTGWRTNWQFGKYGQGESYNVWMDEGLHRPYFEGQPAYITPAVALYKDGPAGFAYNPGTAFNGAWEDHFFVTSFTGSATRGSIWAFTLEEKGATFELGESEQVLQGVLTTSISFGPDGALYLADWISGWEAGEQGRIWRLDTKEGALGARRETEKILAAGMQQRTPDQVAGLLQHEDQRVRMKAQFDLVGRGVAGRRRLVATARRQEDPLQARLHAIWGIGQLGRRNAAAVEPLVDLLGDPEPHVRAQSAKVIGEAGYDGATDRLVPLLDDPSERVRFFAAIALGKVGDDSAVQPMVDMLAEADGKPYLRHAGATGLARIGNTEALRQLADHPSRTVRLAAVVALRRMQSPAVRVFLEDESDYVVTEAARAIHDDTSIGPALDDLARLITSDRDTNEALMRRVINANLRLGRARHARRLGDYAADGEASQALRVDALRALGAWPDPPALDRVEGRYRELGTRDTSAAGEALEPHMPDLLARQVPDTVRIAAANAVGRIGYAPAGGALYYIARDSTEGTAMRQAALEALGGLQDERLARAVGVALEADDPALRQTAQRLISTTGISGEQAARLLAAVLRNGSLEEKQAALQSLGAMEGDAAEGVLRQWMNRLTTGQVEQGIQLDLLLAAEEHPSDELDALVEQYEEAKPEGDLMAEYQETLAGGDVERGRDIVFNHTSAQCLRCHRIDGEGEDVGPDLSDIGAERSRRYLLESLIRPGAEIAPGYGTVNLTLQNGETVSGTLQEETEEYVVVAIGGGGNTRQVAKEQIQERQNAPSGMPSMHPILSRSEVRDVIAYLATLEGGTD